MDASSPDSPKTVKTITSSKFSKYSSRKNILAFDCEKAIQIMNSTNGESIVTYTGDWSEFELSPSAKFLMVYTKSPKASLAKIISVLNGLEVFSFPIVNQSSWQSCFSWGVDDLTIMILTATSLSLYLNTCNRFVFGAEYKNRVTPHQFSYNSLNQRVCVFTINKASNSGCLHLYEIKHSELHEHSKKVCFRADYAEFLWGVNGSLIAQTHAEDDASGKSYYGESLLHFYSHDLILISRITLGKEGPIHDVKWSPLSEEFVVVYGHMPAKATLFNSKGEAVFEFGVAPRNLAYYNMQGNMLCFAGFGNLSGNVETWDRQTLTKVGEFSVNGASMLQWSPTGSHLITATLSPRLRVDNGFKIWDYHGVQLFSQSFKELFQISWVPQDLPFQKLSSSTVVKHQAAGAYRPPSLRGSETNTVIKTRTLDLVVDDSPRATSKVPVAKKPTAAKEILILGRKLNEVKILKQKLADGQALEANQLAKLEKEQEFLKLLEQANSKLLQGVDNK